MDAVTIGVRSIIKGKALNRDVCSRDYDTGSSVGGRIPHDAGWSSACTHDSHTIDRNSDLFPDRNRIGSSRQSLPALRVEPHRVSGHHDCVTKPVAALGKSRLYRRQRCRWVGAISAVPRTGIIGIDIEHPTGRVHSQSSVFVRSRNAKLARVYGIQSREGHRQSRWHCCLLYLVKRGRFPSPHISNSKLRLYAATRSPSAESGAQKQ